MAVEVMNVTGTIRDCIRDTARLDEIYELVADGKDQYGSQTFDQHLMELVKADSVDFETAKSMASNPSDFDLKMNVFGDTEGRPVGAGDAGMADEMSNLFG